MMEAFAILILEENLEKSHVKDYLLLFVYEFLFNMIILSLGFFYSLINYLADIVKLAKLGSNCLYALRCFIELLLF